MKKRVSPTNSTSAFTLIELLVVISIIVLLAALATPGYKTATMNAQMMNALSNARQVGIALHMQANDNGGLYSSGSNSYGQQIVTSNDAFRSLFPTYLDNEKVFTISRAKVGNHADNVIDPSTEILKAGENAYAYIEGLSTSSNSNWPLIVDEDDGSGHYTTVETNLGGTWAGTKAIVIRTDISASLVPLLGPSTQRYIPRFDDSSKNALSVSDYMGSGASLLEPAQQ
jgi:prepilin-type N-terminal cleavage/methylation domain-containing protein